jgi:hypothetical protein
MASKLSLRRILTPLVALAALAAVACSAKSSTFAGLTSGALTDGGGGGASFAAESADGAYASPIVCDAGVGAACVASCAGGGGTSLSGTVYDPAGLDPLYNVAVYIPNAVLPALPRTGPSCGECAAIYPASIQTSTVTAADGTFTLPSVPSGSSIPVVVQAGKWRMVYHLDVVACQANQVPDKTLHLPRSAADGDLPDIAISTGGADSLECLPLRIGVEASEYVGGADTSGHIHLFAGFAGATAAGTTPASDQALWDSTADLAKNDVVLLSCEGQETANVSSANQQALMDYASEGGRVFASHYQYVWFDVGPFGDYPLARWTSGAQIVVSGDQAAAPGDVVTTLGNGQTFPEGVALQTWLGNVGALSNGQLPIWYARHNADVAPSNPISTPWIALDNSVGSPNEGATQYFSFDTPIQSAQPCGRVVYSDLHVSGGPDSAEPGVLPDYPDAGTIGTNRKGGIAPSGCALHPLTPQEKALEFMLFDLSSSCLVPIGGTPEIPR